MSFIARGAKNAFRNIIRTVSIVVILALSTGLALTMLLARQAVEKHINDVKSSIGNTITVSPAGGRGFAGGGEPLTTDMIAKIKGATHVVGVTESLTDQMTSTDTTLKSAIEAGTLGNRQNRQFNEQSNGGQTGQAAPPTLSTTDANGNTATRSFTPPVTALGSNNVDTLASFGGGSVTLSSGSKIDPAADKLEVLVGKTLAEKNSLSVGSTFTAYAQTVTVKGIFDSGNQFSNNLVIFSLPTLQRLSGLTGDVTSAIVQVDSISNMESTTAALKSSLGTTADVVSQQDTSTQALEPLQNILGITLYSLLGAVISGAVIIFLTMLMIVRERRREIGVFKAIGASNFKIVLQFVSEAAVLTLLGSAIGVVAGALVSNSVVQVLVKTSTATATTTGAQMMGGPGGGRGFARIVSGGGAALTNIHSSVGFTIILYGLAGAIAIALIGSAIPAFFISKIRPAEVMRGE